MSWIIQASASLIAYVVLCWVLRRASPRLYLLVLVPSLALDCLGCMGIGGSPRNTLSGEAWHARGHPVWGWTHAFIDFLFGAGHCRAQALREAAYGSVWRAWLADFKHPTPA